MPGYRLSRLAESDLEGIADYTVDAWGAAQAIRYIDGLLECCERVARSPLLGRSCRKIGPGYRRIEQGKHVLFYRLSGEEVLISRILHQDMLPSSYVMQDSSQPDDLEPQE